MKFLDLNNSIFLKSNNLEWLSRVSSLRCLDLSMIDLSEAIHWLQAITKMTSLTKLYLSTCDLPLIIPRSISYMNSSTSLVVFYLSLNLLTSSLYPWLTNFTGSLVHLNLSYNQLQGSIPEVVRNMISLVSLNLSNNQFEGEILKSLSNNLVYLNLFVI